MTNQPYNGITMCTCVYLICVGAVLLPLLKVDTGCECKNKNWTNDNYYDYFKWLVWQLLYQCQILNISSLYIDTGSSALESCDFGGYVHCKRWHHLITKHMCDTWLLVLTQFFQNPGAKTCIVIPCVDMSPLILLSHNLYNRYPIPDPALIVSWILSDFWLCS